MKKNIHGNRFHAVAADDAVDWDHPLNKGKVLWGLTPYGIPAAGPRLSNLADPKNQTNGTIIGQTPTLKMWSSTGRGDSGLTFDGSTQSVSFGDPAAWTPGVTFTLSAWVNVTAAATGFGAFVIGRGTSTTSRLASLEIGSDGKPIMELYDGTNNPFVRYPTSIVGTGWRHLVGVRGNGLVYLYVDGLLSGTATDTAGTVSGGSGALWLMGRRQDGSGWYTGSIADPAIGIGYAGDATFVASLCRVSKVGYQIPDSPLRWFSTRTYSFPAAATPFPYFNLTETPATNIRPNVMLPYSY